MLVLRKILLCDYLYYFIFFLAFSFLFFKLNTEVITKNNDNYIEGIVTDLFISKDKVTLEVKGSNKVLCTYYDSLNENIKLGDKVKVIGEIDIPKKNTNPNLFNYQNYLKSKKIYYVMNADKIEKISSNKNIFYAIKNKIKNIIAHNKASNYLYLFILGDNRYVDSDIKSNYQNLGISHLFSISGMHISILSGIILLLLKKIHISENKRYLLTCLFISFYIFLVNFCPSALRSGIFFILLSINTIFYFNIKPINLLLLTTSIILFFNPYIIYNVGFLFSVVITASLILFSNLLNHYNNYVYKTLMTSFIAFLFSLPISLYNYYQVNILTIFYNLLFVPLVSIIIFPLSLLSFIIPIVSNVLIVLTSILEHLTSFLSLIDSNIIFNKPSLFIVFIYYLVIIIIFKYHKKVFIFLFILMLLIHYNYNVLFPKDYMLMIDVGQGDSILLHSSKYNALIDTGGKLQNSNISKSTLIPLFKSLGIRKIDYLFLTQGD